MSVCDYGVLEHVCVCVWCEISYNRLKSDLRDVQNEAERIRLQPAFVV